MKARESKRGMTAGDDLPDTDIDDGGAEPAEVSSGPVVAFTAIDWAPPAGDGGNKVVGAEVIQALVKRLPNAPGVYRMMNAAGDVLYVGKARSLKKRVTAYAQGRFHTNRIGRMVRETATMEFVVTRTEIEALLLEANLIKRLRPRFNVLMRDDKSFPYILLTGDHPSPGIYKHRGARSRQGDYFGPFASAGAVGRTINSLQRAFLLRTCTDSFYENRTRPCLLFQIKRCSAPCTGEISHADYAALVAEAKAFLSGRSQKVKTEISQAMQEASEALDFERAAIYRDRLAALSHVQSHQGINPQSVEEADVFAIHLEGGQVCIQVFFFRTGQNWGNRAYFPKADLALGAAEILGSFIAQFYDDKPVARTILLSQEVAEQELLAEALSTRAGRKVTVSVPQRGEKKELADNALQNAREALGRRLAETSTQARLLAGFAETFGLEKPPRRIEVYDNSHIMGTNAVGTMIVAGPEGFVKNQYRKFNIRSTEITPGDDFGMMREVMERRFSRLLKEHGDVESDAQAEEGVEIEGNGFPAWPDVILIDGGQGQMTAVRQILSDLGVEDRVVAIGTHRARRKKELVKNPLDEISGIGPGRKRALLLHFGTAKAVSRAAVEDLMAVEGISEQIAKVVYNHFHEN